MDQILAPREPAQKSGIFRTYSVPEAGPCMRAAP
jgi:hypothetical protein